MSQKQKICQLSAIEGFMQLFQSRRDSKVIQLAQARQRLRVKARFKQIGQFVAMLFTKQPEPQVRLQHDSRGNVWWTTYNPVTGETRRFGSQVEMLAWIRDRYLQ